MKGSGDSSWSETSIQPGVALTPRVFGATYFGLRGIGGRVHGGGVARRKRGGCLRG